MMVQSTDPEYRQAVSILETLQARYYKDRYATPTRRGSPEDRERLVHFVASQAGVLHDPTKVDLLRKQLKSQSETPVLTPYENPVLYDMILNRVSEVEGHLESRGIRLHKQLIFGSAPTGRFNGSVVDVGSSRYQLVLIEDGFFSLCHHLAKLLALVTSHEGNRPHFAILPETHLRTVMPAQLRFSDLITSYVLRGYPNAVKQYELKYNRDLYEILLMAMEIFLLAHEYGHVILAHTQADPKVGTPSGVAPSMNRTQEYAADRFAVRLVLDFFQARELSLAIGYSALEALFYFLELLELGFRAYGLVRAESGVASHPGNLDRISAIQAHIISPLPSRSTKSFLEPTTFYLAVLEQFWKNSSPMMTAVCKQFGARPHPKWVHDGLSH